MEEFNFNHFSSFTVNGKKKDISELNDYLIDQNINGIVIQKKLNVGDKVKLKGRDYVVVVKYINYEMPGIGVVDYAGIREDGNNENLLSVFNQSEIENVIFDKKNELNEGEKNEKCRR